MAISISISIAIAIAIAMAIVQSKKSPIANIVIGDFFD